MKRLLRVFLILFLTGCASGPSLQEMKAADPPKDDQLIVPGWRVGKVYLGMTSAALHAAMGEPDSTTPSTTPGQDSRFFSWENRSLLSLLVSYDMKTQQVYEINVFQGSYKTAEGVQIGMSELAVMVKLGKPQASGDRYHCYKRGIMLGFSNYSNDKPPSAIKMISVMPSKEWRSWWACK